MRKPVVTRWFQLWKERVLAVTNEADRLVKE